MTRPVAYGAEGSNPPPPISGAIGIHLDGSMVRSGLSFDIYLTANGSLRYSGYGAMASGRVLPPI
jgi:hypothetical protein